MSAPEKGWQFTSEQENLWKICTETFATLNSHLDQTLRSEADIKLTDFYILSALTNPRHNTPAAVRMGELAQKTNVSPSRLTYQIEVLLRHGWVEKEPVQNDRRGKGIVITPLGTALYERAAQVYSREVQQTALEGIDSSKYQQLSDFFLSVQDRVSRRNPTRH